MSNTAALKLGSPVERLAKVLKENKSKLNMNKDGFVSVDLSSEEALKAIRAQVNVLDGIKTKMLKTR